jgi:hypothetical protein
MFEVLGHANKVNLFKNHHSMFFYQQFFCEKYRNKKTYCIKHHDF